MSSPQIIKQICYNPDNSRLILSSSDNTHYLCDIYGNRKLKFLRGISGTSSTKERKKLAPLSINVSYSSIPKLKFYSDYFPINRKFEGYSFFPRPIAPPFVNIPSFDLNNLCKRELVNQLQKYFSSDDAKVFLNNKGENIGLSFFTCDLNQFDSAKEDSKKLINIIDQTIQDYKEENKFKFNVTKKNPFVSALLKFKNVLEMNGSMKIINGKLMKEPNDNIKNQYNFIYNKIHKVGLKKIDHNKVNLRYNTENNDNVNEEKYDFMDINSITKSNDITLGRKINKKFGIFSYEEEEKRKKEEEEKLKKEEEEKKKKEEEEKLKNEEENTENKKNISMITNDTNFEEEKKNEEKNEDEKNKTNISFISLMSENEKKYEKKNVLPVKSEKQLEENLEKEIKYLPGYKKEIIKETGIVQKKIEVKFKNNGDFFLENLELLKKTNPIAYEIQQKKDEYDFKQLQRQRNQNRINAKNAERNHELKVKKEKENLLVIDNN